MKKTNRYSATPLFKNELGKMLGTEKHLLLLFPLLKNACNCQPLRNLMARSVDASRDHITRLEQIASMIGSKPKAAPPETVLSLAREAEDLIGSTPAESPARDNGCARMAQKIERYQIGVYNSLAELARDQELDDVLELLETSLNEEKETDDMLSTLAENYVNAN